MQRTSERTVTLTTIVLLVLGVVVLLLVGLGVAGVVAGGRAAGGMSAVVEDLASELGAEVESGAGQTAWVMRGDGWTVTARSSSARGPGIENGLTTVFHAPEPSGGLVWAGPKSLRPAKDLKYLLDREVSNLAPASTGDATFEEGYQVFTAGGDASAIDADVRAGLQNADGFLQARALVWSGGVAVIAKGQVAHSRDIRALIETGRALQAAAR
jgi:hypothetical protein